ncbi:hypothetical protein P3339_07620 [Microbulbifer sp. MLAF003]|uniref:hypothetical protein n=1 Tax=Microbulbifer sp. MLAF003 TaxID=3032582 RepID=UPI0024AE795C|nr:hypothetical protein [Microbulbifer sp. MLAF003]WHI52623.1 hypothetical protein P3339_07620 [Microbulbifer sp. MLAF003]
MSGGIYQTPQADLVVSKINSKSASERLTHSRRNIEKAVALPRIKVAWGFRLAGNFLFFTVIIFSIVQVSTLELDVGLIVLGVFLGMYILESYVIIAFFCKQAWCVIPMHVFSILSLLSISYGAMLSVIHFLNMGKIQFNKGSLADLM